MRTPVVCSRITFQHPFSLPGVAANQAAGSYSIETRDRYYWTFPFSMEKRTRTTIRLHMLSGLQGSLLDAEIDPRELFGAMERDRLSSSALYDEEQI